VADDDDEKTATGETAPANWQRLAKPHIDAIRGKMKSINLDAATIGGELTKVRSIVPRGRWVGWLRANFDFTPRMATTFMRVYDMAAALGSENFSDLPISASALYLMARDGTPAATRDELIAVAKSGTKVSHAMAKQKIDAALLPQKIEKAAKSDAAPSSRPTPLFDEPAPYEIDDDRLDVYERARAVLDELKGRFAAVRHAAEHVVRPIHVPDI
jgi:Protein of unknown function (DUF3102)